MRNSGLEEAQDGIKIPGRNINNLRYADDTTLTAESEEELKSLFIFSSLRFGLILCKIHYFYACDILQEVAHNLEAAGVRENWKQNFDKCKYLQGVKLTLSQFSCACNQIEVDPLVLIMNMWPEKLLAL